MPDMTGMSIMGLGGSNDAMSLLSNNVNRTANRTNGTGESFGTVIDATAMSIMASAVIAPQAAQQNVPLPVSGNERGIGAVEITVRTMQTRPNDYSQPTQMSETGTRVETGIRGDEGFDSGLQTAVDTAAQQMTEEAAAVLEQTPEEIAGAMELAGLNPLDLLGEEGLTTLVTTVSGEDASALLTDGALYEDLQTLIGTAAQLKEDVALQFEMSPEALEEAIAQITADNAPDVAIEELQLMTEEMPLQTADAEEAAPQLTQVRERTERTERTEEAPVQEQQNNTVQQSTQTQEAAQSQQQRNGAQQSQQETGAGQRTSRTDVQPDGVQQAVAPVQTFVNTVNEALAATNVTATGAEGTNAADVIRQVLDYMRTEVREGMTQLEMQLNPQSLGRVHVTLAASDAGDMIARFTAQNEAVRETLANQMPQLIQRFEEQGIRVNEIQVTVEQRSFDSEADRNMNREEQQSEQEAAIQRMGRMRRVQIDLASMDAEDIASLDDDARIEAEMMAEEGNTVNYRA